MKSAHFNSITIIQSLPYGEPRTGSKLLEDLEVLNVAYDRSLAVELTNANSKDEFIAAITELSKIVKSCACRPALHIETHGSDDQSGLILGNGDYISWFDLKPYLIELNMATGANLLVFLAACSGAYLSEAIDTTDRSPFWGLAAPTNPVSSIDLLESFSAFYQEILATGNGGQAIRKLNSATSANGSEYVFTSAEMFFKQVYKNYLKENFEPKQLKKRAKSIYSEMKIKTTEPPQTIGQIKRTLINTKKEYLKKHKNHYFMFDLFPENKRRFTVQYSDVE